MHPDGHGIRCREHFAQSGISAESATDTDKGTVRWVARGLLFLRWFWTRRRRNSDDWAFRMTILVSNFPGKTLQLFDDDHAGIAHEGSTLSRCQARVQCCYRDLSASSSMWTQLVQRRKECRMIALDPFPMMLGDGSNTKTHNEILRAIFTGRLGLDVSIFAWLLESPIQLTLRSGSH